MRNQELKVHYKRNPPRPKPAFNRRFFSPEGPDHGQEAHDMRKPPRRRDTQQTILQPGGRQIIAHGVSHGNKARPGSPRSGRKTAAPADPILPDDTQVVFQTKSEAFGLKVKFVPKEMLYRGKLAL
jgi:hypothetical protein